MLAASHPDRLFGPKLNNAWLAGHELARGLLAPAHESKERIWSEASSNDHPSNPVCDVKQAVDPFDFRHFFQKNCRVQVAPKHAPSHSLLPIPERVRSEPLSKVNIKGLTDVTVPFLPSVSFARQTAELVSIRTEVEFPTLTGASSFRAPRRLAPSPLGRAATPSPANDNWSPLEAA